MTAPLIKSLPDSPVRAVAPTIAHGINGNHSMKGRYRWNRGGVTRRLPANHSVSSLPAQSSLQPSAVRASGSFLPARRAHLPGDFVPPALSRLCLSQAVDVLAKVKSTASDLHSNVSVVVSSTHHRERRKCPISRRRAA